MLGLNRAGSRHSMTSRDSGVMPLPNARNGKNRHVLTEIPSPSAGYVITVSASFWFHNHSGLTDANGGPHAGHEYSPRLRGRGGGSTRLSSLPMNGQPRPPGMYRLSAAEWLILPGVICGFYDYLSAGRAVAS
ncbi:hypothetical protein [Novacetimonas pomaceti]|uniref:hypothetical protein n=1 Tax=Novacetimonas pomaceti TaxID=2021998 RepID=UPI001057CD58|nr:hypothetical protein [Novacetimonas pomaceti]